MTGAGEEAEKQPAPLVRLGAFVMTHNRVDVLPGTLRKIIDQTFPPEKVLVIDNASSDGTADVVKSLDDSRLSYVRLEENAGPAGAAKTGIEWARNQGFDWVYWGDDDDPPKQDDAFERLLGIASVEGSEDVGALGM